MRNTSVETDLFAEKMLPKENDRPLWQKILDLVERNEISMIVVPNLKHIAGKDSKSLSSFLTLLKIKSIRLKSLARGIDSQRDSRLKILSHLNKESAPANEPKINFETLAPNVGAGINIKWSSIVSDTFGVAGVKILREIASGVTHAKVLASLATTNIKRKEDAEKALKNYLTTEHCTVIKSLMNQYDFLTNEIRQIENEMTEKMLPYAHLIEELDKIPGIDKVLAMSILAEATTRMEAFPDERKFAAWAGVAPGNNESVGKKKDQNVEKAILI